MAAALQSSKRQRSFFEEDVYRYPPSLLQSSKRHRCSSSSFPTQHVRPLFRRRRDEETEPDLSVKRTKLTHENLNSNPKTAENRAELFVRYMSSATSFDDAKARAAKALEVYEQHIRSRAVAEAEVVAAQKEEENMVLKKEIEEMTKDNMILKRGVSIQNERLKELAGRNQVVEHMQQLVNQYKEQVSKLEVANYGLQMHLKQAQFNNSNPLGFHPHVY